MKTCTVAYATQTVSSVAVTAGARHHGSWRSVRSLICVIVDVSALETHWVAPPAACAVREPGYGAWARRMAAVPCEPYSKGISPRWRGARQSGCDTRYTERLAQEINLEQQQVLCYLFLRCHVGYPGQRQHAVRPAGRQQRR